MEAQTTFDRSEFLCRAVELGPGSPEVQVALAAWEDRERRRIEFRSSLLSARALFAPSGVCQTAQQSAHRLSAEARDCPPTRMMAELAVAH
jgi:hypothetical protein